MGYNKEQFRDLIDTVLKELEEDTDNRIPHTEEAVDLLMMTAAHESHLGTYLHQNGGPAVGAFQMEPTTHEDHWEYITPRDWLYNAFCSMNLECDTRPQTMEYNLKYAIVMCRVHYFRKPEALPRKLSFIPHDHSHLEPTYLEEISFYAKEYYNTHLGKATADAYLKDYVRFCT